MKIGCLTLRWLFAIPLLSSITGASAASVLVYDNLNSTDYSVNFDTGSAEVGDEIVLGYNNVVPTQFDLQYFFNAPNPLNGNETAQVRFYLNNGPLASGTPSPGTLVYDSGIFSLDGFETTRSIMQFDLTSTGGNALDATTPLTDFTWTVQFSGLDGTESAGVTIYSPPVLGNDYSSYWENDGVWQLKSVSGAPSDFAAQVSIPEPATVSILGGLGLAMIVFRRRRN